MAASGRYKKAHLFHCKNIEIRHYWLYVIIMSRTSFRVNPQSIVCLNVKDLLARSSRHIWGLNGSNAIWTHNQLVCKPTLTHLAKLSSLAKWLSFRLRTKWLWVRITLLSLKTLLISPPPMLIAYFIEGILKPF